MSLETVPVALKKNIFIEVAKIDNFFSTGSPKEDRKLAHREAQRRYKKTKKGKTTEKRYRRNIKEKPN